MDVKNLKDIDDKIGNAFKTNKEISEFLFIAEKTVESHKRSICEKLKLPKGKNVLLKWASVNMNKAD